MTAERKLTGKHVLGIFVLAFGVIISVNLVLAFKAVSTFPGLEVDNSYVASQDFDRRRLAQESLGWTLALDHTGDTLELVITDPTGQPIQAKDLAVLVGRKTTVEYDQTPEFIFDGTAYRAAIELGHGAWVVKVDAVSENDVQFEQRLDLWVKG